MFDSGAMINLPADENQPESTECSTESLNRTFELGENTEKLNAIINQVSRTVTRPLKSRENVNTNAGLNTTRTMVRDRQKPMVVETQLISDIRRILSDAKINKFPSLAGLEKKLIGSVQMHEEDIESEQHIETPSPPNSSMELLLYKHFNADLRKMVKLLLSEVQRLRAATNIKMLPTSVGNHRNIYEVGNTYKPCDGTCDHTKRLILDLENAISDLEEQHKDYEKLIEQFDNNRKVLHHQKQEYMQLENVLNEEREMYKQLMEKFLRLRDHAIRQLEHASDEVANCESKHEEMTKGLRLKVKAFELEIKTLKESVLLKRKENDDLQRMLRSIVSDLEAPSDISESENWIN